MQPVVAKLGGNALGSLPDAARARCGWPALVIVHGGGAQISALMRRRGIEPRFVGGRRFTDLPSLACVRKALADVSDELAAAIAATGARGGAAAPRRGAGRRAPARARAGGTHRGGRDARRSQAAWAAGGVPLIAPLARDGSGERYLNVNADDVAAAVAAAIGAAELVFLSDVPGVLAEDGSVIAEISASAPPDVTGGMLPKLAACGAAVAAGVGQRAHRRRHRGDGVRCRRARPSAPCCRPIRCGRWRSCAARARRCGPRTARRTWISSRGSRSCRWATPTRRRSRRSPRQAATLGHVSNLFWTEPGVALAERLLKVCGMDGGAFFCNSGAEANEAAIKLARRRGRARGGPDKHQIVCLEGSFHGRTLATLQATWAPSEEGAVRAATRAASRTCRRTTATRAGRRRPRHGRHPARAGAGRGRRPPARRRLPAPARELCDLNDALLICDEVQTGIGRCGAWLASRRLGVEPDAVTLAKGLASGIPIGALVTRDVEDGFAPGDHATTFGATPPVAAAALAVLDTIVAEDLIGNAERVGAYLREHLASVPGVAGVRGLGLLNAVELGAGDAPGVARRLLDTEHVLVNAVSPTALRLCPPLCLSVADADRAVAAIARVLAT